MSELSVINKTYSLYKTVAELNYKLEKRWRYGLGLSLEQSILGLCEELVMAKAAPKPLKASYLIRASGKQEVAILKLRLYLDLKLANETKIFQAQANLQEIGRMLGGWRKSL